MVKILCKNNNTSKAFPEGVTLMEILASFDFEQPYPILAAKVNNVCQGLKYRAFNSRQVEFLDYTSYAGRSVYCNSLCFLLTKSVKDLFPQSRVILRRPISKGYYCSIDKRDGSELSEDDMIRIKERMKSLVEQDLPFRRHEVLTEDALALV